MKSSVLKLLMPGFVFLFILTNLLLSPTFSGETGKTQNTFVLSDEAPGNLISILIKTEYSEYNIYQVLLQIQADANPAVAGIITPSFLSALASCPAGSQIFTVKLNDFPAGSSIAISTDGTVQTVNFHTKDYSEKAETALTSSRIIGVGDVYFVHSGTQLSTADFNMPLKSWTVGGITYNLFAIASGSVSAPPEATKPKGDSVFGF
jgi:hypothetical protein